AEPESAEAERGLELSAELSPPLDQTRDRRGALQEQAELLHRGALGPRLAGFIERSAVVVGRVGHRRGLPTPRRSADGHVEVLDPTRSSPGTSSPAAAAGSSCTRSRTSSRPPVPAGTGGTHRTR